MVNNSNMIRTTVTKAEVEKLTWTSFENIASSIHDIEIAMIGNNVIISVLGYEITTMTIEDYKSILAA